MTRPPRPSIVAKSIDGPVRPRSPGSAAAGSAFSSRVGSEGEEDQGDRAEDEHVVGEVEDRAVEVDRVDVQVDEVADVPEDQPVVAVAQGPGHDQGQGDGQAAVARRPEGEQPVADPHRGQDRERGEDQAAVGDRPHEPPEGPGVVARLELQQLGTTVGAAVVGLAELAEEVRFVARSNPAPRQGDGPEKQETTAGIGREAAGRDSLDSSAALHRSRQVMQCFV